MAHLKDKEIREAKTQEEKVKIKSKEIKKLLKLGKFKRHA